VVTAFILRITVRTLFDKTSGSSHTQICANMIEPLARAEFEIDRELLPSPYISHTFIILQRLSRKWPELAHAPGSTR